MAMATNIRARIPASLLARSLSSASYLTEKLPEAPSPANPVIDLSDTQRLFASFPTASLLHSLANLSAMAAGPLVDVGVAALRAVLASEGQLLRAAGIGVARATVHRHFCAGEGFEDAGRAVAAMWEEQGLRSILDYGMEDAEDSAACDRNLAGFLRTVEMASSLPPSSITAICPISLLERVSDLLRWEQQDPTLQLPWKTNSIPVLCDSSPLYLTRSAPHPLTEMEECHLQLALQRLSKICERCTEANIQLLIDAEYTSVQPAIDYFTYAAAVRFNHGDHPIVFGTIQAYLRDSKERMVNAVQAAEREGFAQLMGMADGLTHGLRNAGFQVSKYVPFGPVEQVMPYLLRRAEENRGLLCTSIVDRRLIRSDPRMLEQLLIFTRGGLILWELGNALKGSPIDALIRSCILEERSADAAFHYDGPAGCAAYTLKWAFDNDLGLVFVAVYQRILHLLYVDDLLAAARREFSRVYDSKRTSYDDFDETFRQLQMEAEARAEEMRKFKQAGRAPAAPGKKQVPGAASRGSGKQRTSGGGGSGKDESDGDPGNGRRSENGSSKGQENEINENSRAQNVIVHGKENGAPQVEAFDVSKLQKLRSKGGKKTDTGGGGCKAAKTEPKKIAKKNRVWDDSLSESRLDFTDPVDDRGQGPEVVVADQGESMMDKEEIVSSDSEGEEDEEVENEKPGTKKKGWFSSMLQR
ncbi:hypothetical protein BHE74_00007480 [Ensete ventricosum]|nr:hypothetical protein BHE74_00007480 [Ensete ventricosum]